MTAPTVAVAALDQLTARRLVSEARNALALADDVLARLYAGRAWEALGHRDWSALCAAELPELRHLKLRKAPRLERVRLLIAAGATERDVAAATGSSVGQAHNDVRELRLPGARGAGESRCGEHGAPAHVIVARLVAAAGARGLTIPQAQRKTGWTYGATSGALSRAERRGLVHRPAALDPRGGFRPYVAR